jgi:5'-3' exonuclease
MILVDFNQVIFSTISTQFYKVELNEDLLRHMTLNCLRSYRQKFSKDFGELVICVDSRRYWRREVFPFYKSHRKAVRESSGLDWNLIFASMDKIKAEIRDTFPYKYMEVDGAEADDIIAVLSMDLNNTFGISEKVLILSGDKDFVQLHAPYISQYDPIRKRWLSTSDVSQFLKEHIIRGDKGDGIPNIKSSDNSLAVGARQTKITQSFIDSFDELNTDEMLRRNYLRNKQLIDLTQIPTGIRNNILELYNSQQINDKSKLFNYFVKHKLKNLMSSLQDFS